MSEPIEHSGELNEAKERRSEFLVSGADSPVALDAAEEVFDFMATAVVAAMECYRPQARPFWRDAHPCALSAQPRAECVGIEALVCDGSIPAQAGQKGLDGIQIVTLSSCQAERNGSSLTVHDCRQLRVDPPFRATDSLCGLAAARIRSVLVQLDMRAVNVTKLAFCGRRHEREHPSKKTRGAPTPKPCIHRSPWAEVRRQVTPRNTGAQDVENGADHKPIVLRRSSSQAAPAGFRPRTVNFFNPSHRGSGSSQRRTRFMRTLRSTFGSIAFEYTP